MSRTLSDFGRIIDRFWVSRMSVIPIVPSWEREKRGGEGGREGGKEGREI